MGNRSASRDLVCQEISADSVGDCSPQKGSKPLPAERAARASKAKASAAPVAKSTAKASAAPVAKSKAKASAAPVIEGSKHSAKESRAKYKEARAQFETEAEWKASSERRFCVDCE